MLVPVPAVLVMVLIPVLIDPMDSAVLVPVAIDPTDSAVLVPVPID